MHEVPSHASFNIQTALRDLEGRVRGDIAEVRRDVQALSDLDSDLNVRLTKVETKIKWTGRAASVLTTIVLGTLGWLGGRP